MHLSKQGIGGNTHSNQCSFLVIKVVFSRMRLHARPGAHSSTIDRFRLTKTPRLSRYRKSDIYINVSKLTTSLFETFHIEMEGTHWFPRRRSFSRSTSGWNVYLDPGTGENRPRKSSLIPESGGKSISVPSRGHEDRARVRRMIGQPEEMTLTRTGGIFVREARHQSNYEEYT